MRVVAVKDLGPLRAAAKARIDAAAEDRLAAVFTPVAARFGIYAAKQAEARRFLAEGAIGPLMMAEIGLTAPDVEAVAAMWLRRAAESMAAAAGIEAARLKAKADIDSAQTPAAIEVVALI